MPTTRRLIACLTFFATVCPMGSAFAQTNILFIMADDLGWADTSNTLTTMDDPSDFYETPTLDRLATQGMAFTNAYANPTCAPTRSAILSGAYAPRSTNNVFQVETLNPANQSNSLLVGIDQGTTGSNDKIPTSTFTHAETLQAAGYATGYVGKFHVTTTINAITTSHGFDANFGGSTAGAPGSYHASNGTFAQPISPTLDAYASNYTQQYVDDNIKPYATNLATQEADIDALVGSAKHVTDASVDAAIDFMNANSDGPFFVQFSSYAVHTPIDTAQARSDLLAKYQAKTPGIEDSNEPYAALIEGLDQGVARLIDFLENTPDPSHPGQTLDQNTLVIFYSDNGGQQNQANNGDLKGAKGELDEGGIRVPMIAWSGNPALVDGGTVSDQVVMPIDFFPTFASIAGATLPGGQIIDGVDLSGVFADSEADTGRESVYWHLPGYAQGGNQQRPQSVIRKRVGETDWKLTYSYEDQSWELYNLADDLDESDNLSATESALRLQLGVDLLHWLDDVDAPLATVRTGSIQVVLAEDSYAYANGTMAFYSAQTLTFFAGEELPYFTAAIPGDTDGDSDVDDSDLGTSFANYTGPVGALGGKTSADGDTDGDGDIDDSDLGTSFAYYTGPLSLTSVPEPASLTPLAIASLALVRRR